MCLGKGVPQVYVIYERQYGAIRGACADPDFFSGGGLGSEGWLCLPGGGFEAYFR